MRISQRTTCHAGSPASIAASWKIVEAVLEDLDRVHALGVVRETRAETVVRLAPGDRAAVGLERLFELDDTVVEVLVGERGVAGGVDVDRPALIHGRAA